MRNLVFQLQLDTANAEKQLDNTLGNKSSSAGQSAGKKFGSQFNAMVGVYLSKLSFNGLINQINSAVGAFKEIQNANILLTGAVDAYNKKEKDQQEILESTTTTLEEKAIALGYNIDSIYENVRTSEGVIVKIKDDVIREIEEARDTTVKMLQVSDFETLGDALYKKFQGTVTKGTLSRSIADLLRGGISDPKMIEDLITGYADIASAGKSEFISLDEAVAQLTEQFRSERAALGETAGLTDEYISQILPRGLALLQAEGKLRGKKVEDLTDEERALAKAKGIQENFNQVQGTFNEKLDEGLLNQEIFNAKLLEAKQEFGEALLPLQNLVFEGLTPLLEGIGRFINDHPKFVTAITAMTVAFTGTLGVASAFAFVLATLGGPVTLAVVAIGILVTALTFLVTEWETVSGWFDIGKAKVSNFFDFIGNKVPFFKGHLDTIKTFFVDTMTNIQTVLGGLVDFISGVFTGDWERAWKGIKDILRGVLEGAIDMVVAMINFQVDSFNKFFEGANAIGNKIEDITGINVSDIPTIPKVPEQNLPAFAKGGIVGGNSYYGDKMLVRANSGEMFINQLQQARLFDFISGLKGGDTTTNNTSNYYGVDYGSKFTNPNILQFA